MGDTTRRLSFYINSEEVEASFKNISNAMRKTRNELAKMTEGADGYYEKSQKIAELQGLMEIHTKSQKKIAAAWNETRQVPDTFNDINKALKQANELLDDMTFGTDEYIKQLEKISTLESRLENLKNKKSEQADKRKLDQTPQGTGEYLQLQKQQAINRLNKLSAGSEEFVKQAQKIAEINVLLEEYNNRQKQISEAWREQKNTVNTFNNVSRALENAKNELNEMVFESEAYNKQLRKIENLNNILDKHKEAQGQIKTGWRSLFETVKAYTAGEILGNMITGSLSFVVDKIKSTFSDIQKATIDFEQGITNTLTLLDSNTISSQKGNIEEGTIGLVKMGVSVDYVTKSLFDAVSAGQDARDVIGFLDQANRLAVGGVTDLAVATDGITTTLNAFHLEAREATNIADAFFSAQKFGKTTVEQLASEMGKAAPIAAGLGLSYQEYLSAVSQITLSGISTSEAVTYLKSALSSLMKPSKEATEVLSKFGVPFGTTQIKAAGLTKTLEKLDEVIKNHPDEIAKAIPMVEGLAAVQALTGESLDSFKNILNNVNRDIGINSSLSKANAMQQETLAHKMKVLKGETTAMQIELGNKLAPVMKTIIEMFAGWPRKIVAVVDWLVQNSNTLKNLAKFITIAVSSYLAYVSAIKATVYWTQVKEIWTKRTIITQTLLHAKLLATVALQRLLGQSIDFATKRQLVLNAAMTKNVWGAALAALTALAAAAYLYANRINDLSKKERTLIGLKEQMNKATETEKVKLEMLREQLSKTEPGSKTRLKLVKELNEKYPDLLKNIDAERAGMQELNKVFDSYIVKMEQRIKIKTLESELETLTQEEMSAARDLQTGEINNDSYQEKVLEIKERKKIVYEELENQKNIETFNSEYARLQRKLKQIDDDIKHFTKEIEKLETKGDFDSDVRIKIYTSRINSLTEERKILEPKIVEEAKNADRNKPIINGDDEDPDKAKKAYDEMVKAYDDYQKQIEQLRRNYALSATTERDREILQTADKYQETIDNVSKIISELENKGNARTNEENELLRKFYAQRKALFVQADKDIKDIAKKHNQKDLEEREKAQAEILALFQSEETKEINAVEEKYKKLTDQAEKHGIDTKAAEDKKEKEIADIRKKYRDKEIEERRKVQDEINSVLQSDEEREVSQVREKYEKLIEEGKKHKIDTSKLYDKMLAEIAEITEKYKKTGKDIFGMTSKDWDELNNRLSTIGQIASNAMSMWAASNDQQTARENRILEEENTRNEQKKASYQRLYDAKIISEAMYNRRAAAADAELDAKRKQIAQKQNQRNIEQKKWEARINQISGVLKILSEYSANPITAAALVITYMGATELQIAALDKQELPAYGDGGRINKPQVALIGEKGKEIVFSNKMLQHPVYGKLLEAMADIQEGKKPVMPDTRSVESLPLAAGQGKNSEKQQTTVVNNYYSNDSSKEIDMIVDRFEKSLKEFKTVKAVLSPITLEQYEKDKRALRSYSDY